MLVSSDDSPNANDGVVGRGLIHLFYIFCAEICTLPKNL